MLAKDRGLNKFSKREIVVNRGENGMKIGSQGPTFQELKKERRKKLAELWEETHRTFSHWRSREK